MSITIIGERQLFEIKQFSELNDLLYFLKACNDLITKYKDIFLYINLHCSISVIAK